MHPCPGHWDGIQACGRTIMPGLSTHLVQELNASTVAADVILTPGNQWVDCMAKHRAVILIWSELTLLF